MAFGSADWPGPRLKSRNSESDSDFFSEGGSRICSIEETHNDRPLIQQCFKPKEAIWGALPKVMDTCSMELGAV